MSNRNSRLYWRKREQDNIKWRRNNDTRAFQRIKRHYKIAIQSIEREIESFYVKYASSEGISISEAKKRITELDIEEYERKAVRYIKQLNFSKTANREMRLYNVTMKINRLELLKANIRLELLRLFGYSEYAMYDELINSAKKEYRRQSGILGETIDYNEKHIKSIINSSFHNATWSERLWKNQKKLRKVLEDLLSNGILQGKHPRILAKEIREIFDSSIYVSERLMRTEMARVQQDVFSDTMTQGGFDSYEFIAEPDACPVCKELDGKIFKFEDREIGVNAYPMHPNCRCSQAPAMNREEWEKDLERRGL